MLNDLSERPVTVRRLAGRRVAAPPSHAARSDFRRFDNAQQHLAVAQSDEFAHVREFAVPAPRGVWIHFHQFQLAEMIRAKIETRVIA
jgi:hypothetical protein